MATDTRKNVAVIGAGVCGLAAARHLADPAWGFDFTLFEMTDNVGGTWVFTEKTGTDEYGLPIHSSMYKGLRTNLPKEAMMFPDFPHTKQGVSYLSSHDILQYLEAYADHFNVRPHIKFRHYVKDVRPEGSGWRLLAHDVKAAKDHSYYFDAVIICNGHNSAARYSRIAGLEHFKGRLFHSHNYREPTPFRGQRVIIIGAGPSGIDMAFDLANVTATVVLSHHADYATKLGFPSNVILKPDVERVLEDGKVLFKDGSSMDFDIISFCTGYQYTYPFLNKECGITVEDNYVSPLHNSTINILHPTMALCGIFKVTPIFYLTDLQVRYFLKTLIHPELLPSKDKMFEELRKEEQALKESGARKVDYHNLGEKTPAFIEKICKVAGLTPMPQILLRIFFHGYEKIFSDFKNFRNNFYRIIDEDNFTVVDLREITAKPVEHIHNSSTCRCGTIDSTREIY